MSQQVLMRNYRLLLFSQRECKRLVCKSLVCKHEKNCFGSVANLDHFLFCFVFLLFVLINSKGYAGNFLQLSVIKHLLWFTAH